jgi:hypothetical protein
MQSMADSLTAAGADTTALKYVQRLRKNKLVGSHHAHAAAAPGERVRE